MNYSSVHSPLYELLQQGNLLKLPKGQIVHLFDDNAKLSLIKSGYIKRYLITKEGDKSIQVIYGPHDIFPLTPVYKSIFKMDIYSGPEQYYYESMTELEIFSIDQNELQTAIEKDPQIHKDLFYAAGLRLNSYIHRLESMSLRAANKKVAHQLLYLSTIFGEETDSGTMIMVPLTHQTLAEILNLARETVSNCLIRLQEKGVIAGDKKFIITDLDGLKKAAR